MSRKKPVLTTVNNTPLVLNKTSLPAMHALKFTHNARPDTL